MTTMNGIKAIAGWTLIGIATTSTFGGCMADEAAVVDDEMVGDAELALVADPLFTNAEVKSGVATDLCLDVQNGAAVSGTNVRIWVCNGTTAQKWTKTAAGELRSALAPNLCLDVYKGYTSDGTNVRIYTCNGTASQKWTKTALGEYKSQLGVNAGRAICLDVANGTPASGTNVQIFSCNGTFGQRWNIDECFLGLHDCHELATCTNTVQAYTCTCKTGYSGDGITCADTNECATNTHNCDTNATCTNTVGSFTCACNSGFAGNGVTCTDIDECVTQNIQCGANASCVNAPGTFACTCNNGYAGDGFACTDIDECITNNGGCSANATCTNTIGSRACTCKNGYAGDGVTCTDIDECATNNGGCGPNAICTNTDGSRTCEQFAEIRTALGSSLCLDTDPSTNYVFIAVCNDSPTQKWSVSKLRGNVKNLSNPSLCLDSNLPNAGVIMAPCTGPTNEMWTPWRQGWARERYGRLESVYDGQTKVLDVMGGLAVPGTRVQATKINGTNAQRWDIGPCAQTWGQCGAIESCTSMETAFACVCNGPACGTDLIANGNFETSNAGWSRGTNYGGQNAHSGWSSFRFDGTATDSSLSQNVTIPASAGSAMLRFWIAKVNYSFTQTTTVTVQLRDGTGTTVLQTLATYSTVNESINYTEKSFDLTSFKGQTIQLRFVPSIGSNSPDVATWILVDDVSLRVTQ